MAKTLADYRDEARVSLGDHEVIAAFPVWQESDEGLTVRPADVATGAAGFLGGLFGPLGVVLVTAGTAIGNYFRHVTARDERPPNRMADGEVGAAMLIVRSDRLDLHDVDVVRGEPRARLGSHARDERVRIGDHPKHAAALIELSDTRWRIRRRHERAFRNQLTGQGFRIEPLPER